MNFFAEKEYTLTFINNTCFVAPGTGKPVHTNRPFHGLVFYPAGISIFVFEKFGEYKVGENSVFYIPKGSSYRVNPDGAGKGCYAINFDLAENINEKPFVLPIKNHSKAENLFASAQRIWNSKKLDKRLKCRSIFYDILSLICSESLSAYVPDGKKEKLQNAVEYIHESYLSQEISVETLAQMSDMSSTYFRVLFKEIYGVSPLKYINGLKISHAKELIMSDMYPMHEISKLSGFNDDCYFRRVFKSETSLSPNEYKKSRKNGS